MLPGAQVFVSYSRRDRAFTQRLVQALERRHINVLYDDQILVGEDWSLALERMHRSARFVIAVLSPAYLQSPIAVEEWHGAMLREQHEGRVVLLPVLAEPTTLPPEWRTKRYADLTDAERFTSGVNELVRTIGSHVGGLLDDAALAAPTTVEIPVGLIDEIKQGSCVLYAGSGLSAATGLPAWQQFAERLVAEALAAGLLTPQDITFFDSALRDRKTDYVVDEVVGRAPAEFVQTFLEKTFLGRQPLEAHQTIRNLPFAAVLTTNFDDLLEQTFRDRLADDVGPLEVCTPADVDRLQASLARRAFFLLKSYGSLDRPSSMLVSPAQFDAAVSQNLGFSNFIESLFVSRTILFVGCSLEGIEAYLRGVRLRARPTTHHYALCGVLGTSWEAMAGVLERRYNIRVLPYRSADSGDLLHALREVASRVETTTSRPADRWGLAPLKKVTLSNVGPFVDVSVDLHPRVNVLIGNNGVGKSTLLRALAIALVGKAAEREAARLLRVDTETATVLIETDRDSYTTIVQKGRAGVELTSLPTPVLEGQGFLALGFPALRISSGQRRQAHESIGFPTVEDVLPLARGGTDARLDDLQEWLVNLDHRAQTERNTGAHDPPAARVIARFFHILSRVLEGVRVEFHGVDPITGRVIVGTDDGVVPLDYVSQGTSSIISWVGVVVQRLYEIYKDDTDPTKRYVLVLMDEIDAHMHPAWQRVLLPRLLGCFENMQLIVTTHSPLVLNGLDAECILHVVRTPDQGGIAFRRYEMTLRGQQSDDILTGPLFGLEDTRDVGTGEKEKEYDRLRHADPDSRDTRRLDELAQELFGRQAPDVESSTAAVMHAVKDSIAEKLGPRTADERAELLREAERLLRDAVR